MEPNPPAQNAAPVQAPAAEPPQQPVRIDHLCTQNYDVFGLPGRDLKNEQIGFWSVTTIKLKDANVAVPEVRAGTKYKVGDAEKLVVGLFTFDEKGRKKYKQGPFAIISDPGKPDVNQLDLAKKLFAQTLGFATDEEIAIAAATRTTWFEKYVAAKIQKEKDDDAAAAALEAKQRSAIQQLSTKVDELKKTIEERVPAGGKRPRDEEVKEKVNETLKEFYDQRDKKKAKKESASEKAVDACKSTVSNLKDTGKNLDKAMKENARDLKMAIESLETLSGTIETMSAAMETVSTAVNTFGTRVETLSTRLEGLTTRITALEGAVNRGGVGSPAVSSAPISYVLSSPPPPFFGSPPPSPAQATAAGPVVAVADLLSVIQQQQLYGSRR